MTDPATGRPIVAELGRPETAEEKASRVAAARAKRRANQSTKNLLLSIGASLAIVLFLVLVAVRTDPTPPTVDYLATAQEAEGGLGRTVIAPIVPPGWSANRADLGRTGGVNEWYVGFVTDSTPAGFIAMVQGFDANPTWQSQLLRGPRTDGEQIEIGGATWTLYDRRGNENLRTRQYALVTDAADSTIVLYGTATESEFALLATAISADLIQP